MNNKSSYRSILKATSIFGGVQVFQIIISIIRSKVVAVLLGPNGMGFLGLFSSSLAMIANLTNMGLSTSAIKNIAVTNASGDTEKISTIIAVFRRLIWFTGGLGMIIVIAISPWLSNWAFGNYSYTSGFIILSLTLLINQQTEGQSVLLRGLRKVKEMAQAKLWGTFLGLVFTLPLYYFFKEEGIVPAILISSVIGFLVMFYFAKKFTFPDTKVNLSIVKVEGKEMLVMGFFISLSATIGGLVGYLVRIFISSYGSISDVGLYTAGFAIINTYVGLVFNAMAMDYYPKLSEVVNQHKELRKVVNHQAEITILLVGPILLLFILLLNWIIVLLYSNTFLPIYDMLLWAALGVFFKAASWPLGFIFLAKGKSRLFMVKEIIVNVLMLSLNILGYWYYGLVGLGVSYLVVYIFNVILLVIISNNYFSISYSFEYIKLFFIQLILGISVFYIIISFETVGKFYPAVVIVIIGVLFSLYELNKRLDLLSLIKKR